MTFYEILQSLGVGILLIPFSLMSYAVIIKAKKLMQGGEVFWGMFFLVVNILVVLMPAGMLFAAYLDNGLEFLLLSVSTGAGITACYFFYENTIRKTFIIKLDEDVFSKLYNQAKEENVCIKAILYKKLK